MIFDWIKRNLRLIIACLALLVIVIGLVLLTQCRDNGAAEQAQQTSRSGEAISAAASDAIETIGQRVATEDNIDTAVGVAVTKIEGAQDPEAVRSAVLEAVCRQASHRNDPACKS